MLFVVLPNGEFKIPNYSQFAKHLRFFKSKHGGDIAARLSQIKARRIVKIITGTIALNSSTSTAKVVRRLISDYTNKKLRKRWHAGVNLVGSLRRILRQVES